MKKVTIIFMIIMLLTVCCLSVVACNNEENTVKGIQIEDDGSIDESGDIEDIPSGEIQIEYSEGAVRVGKEILFNLISSAIQQSYGEILSNTQKKFINDYIENRIIQACIDRKLQENDFMSVIRVIDKYSDGIVEFLKDLAEDKKVLQINVQTVEDCFKQFTVILGVDNASLLCYDLLLGYLDYKIEDCLQKYDRFGAGYEFYLEFAEEYKFKKNTVVKYIGEDNFKNLLRIAYSNKDIVMSFFSQDANGDALQNLSATQIKSYLNAQGDLLGNITVSAEGWSNIFKANLYLGNDVIDSFMQVAIEQGDADQLAKLIPVLISYSADCLQNIDNTKAQSIKNDGTRLLLKYIMQEIGYEQGVLFDNAIALIFDSADYSDFIEKNFSLQQYEDYIDNSQICSFDELYNNFVQGDNADMLQAYLNFRLPVIAFLIYANAGY